MLKKKICSILTGVLTLSAVVSAFAVSPLSPLSDKDVDKYENLIKSIDNISDISITDMDGDNVPEVILEFGSGANANVQIYTLSNGSMTKLYDFRQNSADVGSGYALNVEMTTSKTVTYAIISKTVSNNSWSEHEFFYKDGDKIVRNMVISYNEEIGDGESRYKVDNVSATKGLYDTTIKKYYDFESGTSDKLMPRIQMSSVADVLNDISTLRDDRDSSIIKVLINGTRLKTQSNPEIVNNSTVVPMRDIFEALGAKVSWDGATKSIMATKGSVAIKLTINNTDAVVNGKNISVSPAPFVNDKGVTMVPLRFISETLGANVDWDKNTRTAKITMK